MFLSEDDVRGLTGYKQTAKQIKWLTDQGFTFYVRADGRVAILREHVETLMCNSKHQPRPSPNFSALR